VTSPILIHEVKPDYSDDAKQRRAQGSDKGTVPVSGVLSVIQRDSQ
jgi:hypothetical protein